MWVSGIPSTCWLRKVEGSNARTSASIAYDGAHDNSNDALAASARRSACRWAACGTRWGPTLRLRPTASWAGTITTTTYAPPSTGRSRLGPSLHEGRQGRPAGARTASGGLHAPQGGTAEGDDGQIRGGPQSYGRGQTGVGRGANHKAMYAVFGDQANAKLRHGRTLVIDAGSRTFDWLVTLDSKVVGKMSDSVNRGVHDILLKIAAAIASETGRGYLNLEAIDRALRSRKPLRAYKRSVDLKEVRQHDREDRRPGRLDAPWQAGRDRRPGAHRGGGWRDASVPRIDSAEVPEIAISEVDEPSMRT